MWHYKWKFATKVLDSSHDYYYQVQGQMIIWKKDYCDFVCWTNEGCVVTRIKYNVDFFKVSLVKLMQALF